VVADVRWHERASRVNPPLEWILVVAAGLVAGGLAAASWRASLALGGLGILFLAAAIVWGSTKGVSPSALLSLEGGQIAQLVAVAYACAVASAITAIRAALRGKHAT
jgi:hypothetical protein